MEFLLLGLEEFGAFLFLLSLAEKGLRSQLHLGPNTGDLLPKLQMRCSKLNLIILNLRLILRKLSLEILPQQVILLQVAMNLLAIPISLVLQFLDLPRHDRRLILIVLL